MKRLKQIKLSKKAFLFIACLLFFCMGTANKANGQSLTGIWNIDQVKIKKTVNDVVSEKTYSMEDSFEIFADCPQKVTFKTGNKVVFEYDDKASCEAPYSLEGNKIIRMTPDAFYEYEYAITGSNNIQLIYSIDYYYNHSDGRVDKITEECTFIGHKK